MRNELDALYKKAYEELLNMKEQAAEIHILSQEWERARVDNLLPTKGEGLKGMVL